MPEHAESVVGDAEPVVGCDILLIHWHDLGRRLGCYGSGAPSPVLDRLAAEGLRFSSAFSAASLCTPARSALFTGRYPHSNGLMGLAHLGWSYNQGETARTLPALLGRHGWTTALIGLQHEATDPTTLGFGEVVTVPGDYGDQVARRAGRWIRDHADDERPFFLTVGFKEVHRPYPSSRYAPEDPAKVQVPGFLPDSPWVRDDLAAFDGCVRAADAAVGRLLDDLAASGRADRTWVIFTTDHGIPFPGAKSTLTDAGIGVALIMRPPRDWHVTPGIRSDLVSHVDLVPTILERLGLPTEPDVQGVSFASILRSAPQPSTRTAVFAEKAYHDNYDPILAIRTRSATYRINIEPRQKLVLPVDIEAGTVRLALWEENDPHLAHRDPVELYDLDRDPFERNNLAEDPGSAALRGELESRLEEWRRETGDPLLNGRISPPQRRRSARFGALGELVEEPDAHAW